MGSPSAQSDRQVTSAAQPDLQTSPSVLCLLTSALMALDRFTPKGRPAFPSTGPTGWLHPQILYIR